MLATMGWRRWRIYHGTWGSALFQSVYHTAPGTLRSLPTTPEWYLVVLVLTAAAALSAFAGPRLMFVVPLAVVAAALPLAQAIVSGIRAIPADPAKSSRDCWKRRALVGWFCLMQPAARLLGRMRSGLNPWRFRRSGARALPRRRIWSLWSEQWHSNQARLERLERLLRVQNAVTIRGGDFDHWDLGVLGGLLGSAQLKLAVEEHGGGKQMVRVRAWPTCSRTGVGAAATLLAVGVIAGLAGAPAGCAIALLCSIVLLLLAVEEAAVAMGAICKVVSGEQLPPSSQPTPARQ